MAAAVALPAMRKAARADEVIE